MYISGLVFVNLTNFLIRVVSQYVIELSGSLFFFSFDSSRFTILDIVIFGMFNILATAP